MGGCRCSYKNCSIKSDGTTHMFHFPVFDKVRCHQWLTNSQRLDFLNLKVSQLKNRVICQHHFKDDNFMNFMKNKLTFDAVPTLDGPFFTPPEIKCDVQETPPPVSVEEIENESLTLNEKIATFSVKYGDFLTNNDPGDNFPTSQINLNLRLNDIKRGNDHIFSKTNNKLKIITPRKKNVIKTFRKPAFNPTLVAIEFEELQLNPNTEKQNNNHVSDKNNDIINEDTPVVIASNVIENNNKPKTLLYDSKKPQTDDIVNLNIAENNLFTPFQNPPQILNLSDNINTGNMEQTEDKDNNAMDCILVNNLNIFTPEDIKPQNQIEEFQKPINTSTPYQVSKNQNAEKKSRIKILSEKTISSPVPIIGKLEPLSPSLILPFPNKKKKMPQLLEIEVPALKTEDHENNKIEEINQELQKLQTFYPMDEARMNTSNSEVLLKKSNELLGISESCKKLLPHSGKKKIKNVSPTVNTKSILKHKLTPERLAVIDEKRKFNMKLRDIIQSCLENLDSSKDELPDNCLPKKALAKKQNGNLQVSEFLSQDPKLPSNQENVIAFLETRMERMENKLLNRIDQNSRKISELKISLHATDKKNVSTQSFNNEDAYKRHLYKEISPFLSSDANSTIYEELFLKKLCQVPKCGPSTKRRRCR